MFQKYIKKIILKKYNKKKNYVTNVENKILKLNTIEVVMLYFIL